MRGRGGEGKKKEKKKKKKKKKEEEEKTKGKSEREEEEVCGRETLQLSCVARDGAASLSTEKEKKQKKQVHHEEEKRRLRTLKMFPSRSFSHQGSSEPSASRDCWHLPGAGVTYQGSRTRGAALKQRGCGRVGGGEWRVEGGEVEEEEEERRRRSENVRGRPGTGRG